MLLYLLTEPTSLLATWLTAEASQIIVALISALGAGWVAWMSHRSRKVKESHADPRVLLIAERERRWEAEDLIRAKRVEIAQLRSDMLALRRELTAEKKKVTRLSGLVGEWQTWGTLARSVARSAGRELLDPPE